MRALRCAFLAAILLGCLSGSAWSTHDKRVSAKEEVNTWAGTWDTNYGQMKLNSSGDGTYDFCEGKINGSRSGNKLTGTWTQKWPCGGAIEASGRFEFTLAENGQSWQGRARYASRTTWLNWDGKCSGGPCLDNGLNPGKATMFFAAHQFFNDGGDVTVAVSAKLKSNKRCKQATCSLAFEPTARYYGLYTQDDNDFRARFRVTRVTVHRFSNNALNALVIGVVTDRKGGGTRCPSGATVYFQGFLPTKRSNARINCGGERHNFRKYTLRVIGNALSG